MHLKSLELVGFKSFVERTTVNFEEGVTGIVGPNGCGKSNVVDAIRWVMGEQSAKHLRGSSMGDVIFNGTDTRPSMGMASVFLTFDNSDGRAPAEYADYTEITVGRRLYRSGESEYYINKTPCRLKDIIDIFLGTGIGTRAYAIVEQGTIGQILSAKPEDRRMLIEEAAGISKFKVRKEAAQRKMESTRTNLARLTDILRELERQINSLYRQAKKAERYKKFTDELRELDLKVSSRQYKDMREELDGLQKDLTVIKETEVAGGSRLGTEEMDIESARIRLSELEAELDGVHGLLYEKQNEVQLTEAGIKYKEKEIEGLTVQMDKMTPEIEDLKVKMNAWREELEAANSKKVEADLKADSAAGDMDDVTAALEAARDEHQRLVTSLENNRKRIFELVEQVSTSSSELEQLKRREIELTEWIAKDQAEIDKIDAHIKDTESKIGERNGELSGTSQMRLELGRELGATQETLKSQKEELERIEAKVASLKEELGNKRSRLFSLDELNKNYEGYQDGVRAVLKRREGEGAEQFNGVFGTINEFVETEPQYEAAVGAVLGEKLQYVVVKSHEVGVEAIDYLKTEACGRSTFIPMELRSEEMSAAPAISGEGVIGPLANYVNYTDDYKRIAEYLFKDVVLVEDLKKALNLWADNGCNSTLVTMDGEVVDPSGIVSGGLGSDGSKQLMTHRREIKELTSAIAAKTSELNVEEQMFGKIKDRVAGLEKNIEKLEDESHTEELKLVNHQNDLHHLEQEVGYYSAQRDKLSVEVAALSEEKTSVQKDQEEARVKFETGSSAKATLEMEAQKDSLREAEIDNELQGLIQRRTELEIDVRASSEKADSIDKEIRRLIDALAEAYTGIVSRESDMIEASHIIRTSNFSIDCKRKFLHDLIGSINELKTSLTDIKNKYDQDLAALREKEASIKDLRRHHQEQVGRMHEIELGLTQKSEKLNYTCREIFDRYRVDLIRSFEEFLSDDINLEEAAAHVAELKEKVDNIGPVNIDAIKEYDELKVRYDFLKTQCDDLTASLEDLEKAIQKINRSSRARFQEAFESVNERFQKLFPKLFDGGRASLVLTDDQNILDSGVDILAQPPGKKLQSITLLSGGEKALTAVALIFALFLHRPSPFCLLDEVDAPLDDANIDRFNELIREMTKLSQFILITHNKRTMELADTLYGVTMEEKGVSKIISISLANRKSETQAA